MRDADRRRNPPNITGPGINGRSTTAEELFGVGYPEWAIPIAGKTGTAQGRFSYPWNDSSVFAAFSIDSPSTRTRWSRTSRSRGSAREARRPSSSACSSACPSPTALDPVSVSEPLDPDERPGRPSLAPSGATPLHGELRRPHGVSRTGRPGSPGRLSAELSAVVALLTRKPDSGLGNIRVEPGRPEPQRRLDAAAGPGLLAVAGCFIVYSASRTRARRPVLFVDPAGDLRHRRRPSCWSS